MILSLSPLKVSFDVSIKHMHKLSKRSPPYKTYKQIGNSTYYKTWLSECHFIALTFRVGVEFLVGEVSKYFQAPNSYPVVFKLKKADLCKLE